jgi:hypothetical protein
MRRDGAGKISRTQSGSGVGVGGIRWEAKWESLEDRGWGQGQRRATLVTGGHPSSSHPRKAEQVVGRAAASANARVDGPAPNPSSTDTLSKEIKLTTSTVLFFSHPVSLVPDRTRTFLFAALHTFKRF